VLRTTAELVARASGSAPPILFDLPGLPAVSADEAALGRVVVILLRNAFDALVGVEDAQVTVTAAVRMDLGACGPARWVEVAVGDNGPGVPPADRARVFEPFFTSKDVGAGLGLGLAIARELVEAQGGSIALAPPAARGTTFLLRLPVES
jgi:two-component system C4-dicarboxylate transport sensor histidine kinase DctB